MNNYLSGQKPRRVEGFGQGWQFALTNTLELPDNPPWQDVQLPHDWSVNTPIRQDSPCGGMGGYFSCGIGWYRKRFAVDAGPSERVELLFEGVYKECDLWVNGKHIGSHYNGYVSFAMDVTPALRPGENECLLRVNNADVPNSRWYTGSGVTRNVFIRATQPTRVAQDGLYVNAQVLPDGQASVQVHVQMEGAQPGDQLTLEILQEGAVCAEAQMPAQQDTLTIPLQNPCLWSPSSPALYTLRVRCCRQSCLLDETQAVFGIRSIRFDPMDGFFLNGQAMKLNGVCLHHDGGCVGAAVPPKVWRRRLMKLKEMGCNAIRMSHNAPDPALLELCDEMGFLVNAELFDEWREVKRKTYNNLVTDVSHGYGEVFDHHAREDTLSMVRRDRNHPCIILWSVGNEIPEQTRPEGVEIVRQLISLVKQEDDTRPVTTANDNMHAEPLATLDDFMAATEVVGCNYIDRWRSYAERMFEPDKLAHPERVYYGSEHSAIYGWRGDYTNAGKSESWFLAPYASRMLKAERLTKFVQTRPYVCGDFMWTGIDHLGESSWPSKSSISGVIDTAGFPKDGYFFYQSVWVKDRPVLHLFPWLNLDVPPETVKPFVVYTNCASVELLVNGRSYGVKAYEFPAMGMREYWDGFEHPIVEITTNDLHLTWDVPYQEGVIEAIGYDYDGREIARTQVKTAGTPALLQVTCDTKELRADGYDVAQFELTLVDDAGVCVPHMDLPITVTCEGPVRLLGMDNGKGDCHIPFASHQRPTHCGKLYAIVQNSGAPGLARVSFSAPGLAPVELSLNCR